jgi:hypothetical protein
LKEIILGSRPETLIRQISTAADAIKNYFLPSSLLILNERNDQTQLLKHTLPISKRFDTSFETEALYLGG